MENKTFFLHKIDNLLSVKKICTVHYQKLKTGYVSKEEKHDFWEFIYADKGRIDVVYGGKREHLKQGEIVLIGPNVSHYVESGEEEPNIFIISFECRSEGMQLFRDRKISVPKARIPLLQTMMAEALGTFDLPDFDPDLKRLKLLPHPLLGGEQMLKNSLECLLIYLLRRENERAPEVYFVSKSAGSSALEDEIVRFLRGKIYGTFSLEDLSAELHYGKVKLCTFFREKTGSSIYKTYLKLKTDEAKQLIRKGKSFAEIAELLCFDSVSSFHNSFRKIAGMTPGEYRNSIR